MKPQIIIIDGRETLLQSIISDGLTFSLLALFIWISQGSNLWTFTTWMMFIVFLFGKFETHASGNNRRFANCEEAIAFLEGQK